MWKYMKIPSSQQYFPEQDQFRHQPLQRPGWKFQRWRVQEGPPGQLQLLSQWWFQDRLQSVCLSWHIEWRKTSNWVVQVRSLPHIVCFSSKQYRNGFVFCPVLRLACNKDDVLRDCLCPSHFWTSSWYTPRPSLPPLQLASKTLSCATIEAKVLHALCIPLGSAQMRRIHSRQPHCSPESARDFAWLDTVQLQASTAFQGQKRQQSSLKQLRCSLKTERSSLLLLFRKWKHDPNVSAPSRQLFLHGTSKGLWFQRQLLCKSCTVPLSPAARWRILQVLCVQKSAQF